MVKIKSQRKVGRLAFEANILDILDDPVILIDNKRIMVDANLAAKELLGEEALGCDLKKTLATPKVIKAVNAILAGKQFKRDEITIPSPIARTLEMSVWELQPRSKSKESWAILVFHDVTAAKKVDQMRVDFISNVSHELRSPLSSLISFIETLRGPANDDHEAREHFLAIMEAEAKRMAHLINDLLALSKLESEEHIQPEGKIDLYRLLKQVINVLSVRSEKRSMKVKLKCQPKLPAVNGEEGELTQVFLNLIDNAINYGYEGALITVNLKAVDQIPNMGTAGVKATVVNQGDGIEPEHLSRLTERFYRVDKGRSRSMGGTGLGLAIVKHIINRHRGHLDIDSNPNGKTSFSVYLPRANLFHNNFTQES